MSGYTPATLTPSGGAPAFPSTDLAVTDGGGLNLDIGAGSIRMIGPDGFTFADIPAQTLALTDDATNYVQIGAGTTTVAKTTTAFITTFVPIAEVVTASGVITSITNRYMLGHSLNNVYHRTDTAFPQQIWGKADATTLGYLDMELGDFQLQGLNGAGDGRNVFIGGGETSLTVVRLPKGSAAAPSHSFIGDATTGMWRRTTPAVTAGLSFAYLGIERGRLTTATNPDDTGFFVERNLAGVTTLQRVSQGASDSGGVGFRALRVIN